MPTTHASPLVGRAAEVERLAALTGLTDSGTACAVVVAGDAGVGKTRLLTELAARAEPARVPTLVGHCTDIGDGALPFLPFGEMFGRLEAAEPDRFADLAARHPALLRLRPGRRAATSADGPDDSGRADLFDAVHAALEELAAPAGLLVLVEDLHWADPSTRDLVTLLFTRGFAGQVAVVASYRSDDLHRRHPLRARAAEWARLPGVERLQVGPLPDADVRLLVRGLCSGLTAEPDVREIVRRAEGNAFFAEELALARAAGDAALPADLADLLLLRLDRLDDAPRTVVRAVACAGRPVAHELLVHVLDLDDEALEGAVRTAVDSNVLVPVDGTAYAFRHALLAEVVYDDLLPGERQRLHAAYVRSLQAGGTEGTAGELAHHALAAQDVTTAVIAGIQAGDDAAAVGGPHEAATHYLRVLGLLDRPGAPDVDGTDLTVRAADALLASGHPHRSADLIADFLRQRPGGPTGSDRARLLLAQAAALREIDTDVSALDVTAEAITLAAEDPSLRARALTAHAYAAYDRGRDADATRFAEEAHELASARDQPRVASEAAMLLGRLKEGSGDPDASLAALGEVVSQARRDDDVVALIRGLHLTGTILFEVGELTRARTVYLEAAAIASEHGRPWSPNGLDARLLACLTAYMTGDWDAVAAESDVSDQSPPPLVGVLFGALALSRAVARGDDDAARLLDQVREWWPRDAFVCVLSAGAAIDLHGQHGDVARAVAVHDEAVRTVSTLWHAEDGLFQARVRLGALLLGQLADAAARAGSDAEDLVGLGAAEANAAERTVSRATATGRPYAVEGRAWQARAKAEMLHLRWVAGIEPPGEDELIEAWQRAVDGFEDLGQPYECARSEARLARALRAAGRAQDASRLTERAVRTAERLGARPLLVELRDLTARPTPGSSTRGGHELTPREREVLALVAEGRTNGQIAGQLFISTKTASVHVSSILAKLGASGRTEAAAVARRRGLLADPR
ncbi:helix-turn-helix transcriptional regulator [Georgenia halophila]|uniref:Helix-turn-helix transcriptional regulator n=1 Tax=Georgenia halophila TaxID=620889 RepID=A0ABP8LL00_9MICO